MMKKWFGRIALDKFINFRGSWGRREKWLIELRIPGFLIISVLIVIGLLIFIIFNTIIRVNEL